VSVALRSINVFQWSLFHCKRLSTSYGIKVRQAQWIRRPCRFDPWFSQSLFYYACLQFILETLCSEAKNRVDCFHSSNYFNNQNNRRFVSGFFCIKMSSKIAQNRTDLTYSTHLKYAWGEDPQTPFICLTVRNFKKVQATPLLFRTFWLLI